MITSLKDVKDECSKCEKLFECELCKQGHGFKQDRSHITEMIGCQMRHEVKRKDMAHEHSEST